MNFNAQEIIKQTYKNKVSIAKSEYCGCYDCCNMFIPGQIVDYIDNKETALCPYCSMDSVIGSIIRYNINSDFLKNLKKALLEY